MRGRPKPRLLGVVDYSRSAINHSRTAGKGVFPSEAEALERDRWGKICFVRLTARRTDKTTVDLYDPALGIKVGVDR